MNLFTMLSSGGDDTYFLSGMLADLLIGDPEMASHIIVAWASRVVGKMEKFQSCLLCGSTENICQGCGLCFGEDGKGGCHGAKLDDEQTKERDGNFAIISSRVCLALAALGVIRFDRELMLRAIEVMQAPDDEEARSGFISIVKGVPSPSDSEIANLIDKMDLT